VGVSVKKFLIVVLVFLTRQVCDSLLLFFKNLETYVELYNYLLIKGIRDDCGWGVSETSELHLAEVNRADLDDFWRLYLTD